MVAARPPRASRAGPPCLRCRRRRFPEAETGAAAAALPTRGHRRGLEGLWGKNGWRRPPPPRRPAPAGPGEALPPPLGLGQAAPLPSAPAVGCGLGPLQALGPTGATWGLAPLRGSGSAEGLGPSCWAASPRVALWNGAGGGVPGALREGAARWGRARVSIRCVPRSHRALRGGRVESFRNDLSDVFPLTDTEIPTGPSPPSVRRLRGFVSRAQSAAALHCTAWGRNGGRVEGNTRGKYDRSCEERSVQWQNASKAVSWAGTLTQGSSLPSWLSAGDAPSFTAFSGSWKKNYSSVHLLGKNAFLKRLHSRIK